MSLRDQQIARVNEAQSKTGRLRFWLEINVLNIHRKSSLEIMDTAERKLSGVLESLTAGTETPTPNVNQAVNEAISYASAAVRTIEQYGIEVPNDVLFDTWETLKKDPAKNFRETGEAIAAGANAVGKAAGAAINLGANVLQSVVNGLLKALSGPLLIILVLVAVVALAYFFVLRRR